VVVFSLTVYYAFICEAAQVITTSS